MKKKWSTVLFCAAALLLAAALGFAGMNIAEARQAGQSAQQAGQAVLREIAVRRDSAEPSISSTTAERVTHAPAQPVATPSGTGKSAQGDGTTSALLTDAPQALTEPLPTIDAPGETLADVTPIAVTGTQTEPPAAAASLAPTAIPAAEEATEQPAPPETRSASLPTVTATNVPSVEIVPEIIVTDDTEAVGDVAVEAEAETIPAYPVVMPSVEVDGNDYIGMLDIPALQLSLPIMDEWSYERLKLAPCRFLGTQFTHNLTLIAHNYDTHFGRLQQLREGDEISFTDVDGRSTRYLVREIATLSPVDIARLTGSDYDLSLVTCTVGGSLRVAVYCEAE